MLVNQLGADIPRTQIDITGRKLTAALDFAANYNFVRGGLLPGRKKQSPEIIACAVRPTLLHNLRRHCGRSD